MTYRKPDPDYFPDPVDHQGKWFQDRSGKMYKSIRYDTGSVEWVPEGTTLTTSHRTYNLKYTGWEKFWKGSIKENVS